MTTLDTLLAARTAAGQCWWCGTAELQRLEDGSDYCRACDVIAVPAPHPDWLAVCRHCRQPAVAHDTGNAFGLSCPCDREEAHSNCKENHP